MNLYFHLSVFFFFWRNQSVLVNITMLAIKSRLNQSVIQNEDDRNNKGKMFENCRICLQSLIFGELIEPCHCKGTMAKVHKDCLETWLSLRNLKSCEICCFDFKIRIAPKYQPFEMFRRWRKKESFRNMWFCIIFIGLMVPLQYKLVLHITPKVQTFADKFEMDSLPTSIWLHVNESLLAIEVAAMLALSIINSYIDWVVWKKSQNKVYLVSKWIV